MSVKARKRTAYSPEFKAEAVAKCLKLGISATSKELGIPYVTLRSWVSKSKKNTPDPGDKPSYEQLEQEVEKLKREIGYINDINRVLKKSTAIFSSSEMGDLRWY